VDISADKGHVSACFCVPPGSQAWPGFPLARLQRGTKFPLKLFSIFGFAVRILALGFDSREPVSAFRSSVVRSAVTLFRPVAISTGFDFRFLRSAVVTFSFCSVLTVVSSGQIKSSVRFSLLALPGIIFPARAGLVFSRSRF
jgi:hypothetical protein